MTTELTLQHGGWPRTAVVWVTSEAGDQPPARDWRDSSYRVALRVAMLALGITAALVTEIAATDDYADAPDAPALLVRLVDLESTPCTRP